MAEKVEGTVTYVHPTKKFCFLNHNGDRVYLEFNEIKGRVKPELGQVFLFEKMEVPETDRRKPDDVWKAVKAELKGGTKTASTSAVTVTTTSSAAQSSKTKGLLVTSLDTNNQSAGIEKIDSNYGFYLAFIGKDGPEAKSVKFHSDVLVTLVYSGETHPDITDCVIPLSADGLILTCKATALETNISFLAPGEPPVTKKLCMGW